MIYAISPVITSSFPTTLIFVKIERSPNQKIAVFSSNYELYGELTGRVVSIIRQEAPAYFRYSIDECFIYLDGMENVNMKQWGEDLHKKIKQYVGMPVSIGLALQFSRISSTSTLNSSRK